jgi:hypothetical protein
MFFAAWEAPFRYLLGRDSLTGIGWCRGRRWRRFYRRLGVDDPAWYGNLLPCGRSSSRNPEKRMLNQESITMKHLIISTLWALGLFTAQAEDGFKQLFDGKTLAGWDGNPAFWSVQDGAITGITSKEKPTRGNTFCIWRGGEPADFELHVTFRIGDAGNSGVQFRSKDKGNWVIAGYQADFDAGGGWIGTLYEEKGRGVLAKRGNKVTVSADGKKQNTGKTATEDEIKKIIKKGDWNHYVIKAKGNHLTQTLNGVMTVDVTDDHEKGRAMKGLIALQLHAGPPMKVQFKDIKIKDL